MAVAPLHTGVSAQLAGSQNTEQDLCQILHTRSIKLDNSLNIEEWRIYYQEVTAAVVNAVQIKNLLYTEPVNTSLVRVFSAAGTTLCLAMDNQIVLKDLTKKDWEAWTKSGALLTDLKILKDGSHITCQAQSPSTTSMGKEKCQAIIKAVLNAFDIPEILLEDMDLTPGVNLMYLTNDTLTSMLPSSGAYCFSSLDPIMTKHAMILNQIEKLVTNLRHLDATMGSTFISHLKSRLENCGSSLDEIPIYTSEEDWICSNKRRKRSIRKKRFSLLSMGGGESSMSPELLKTINHNFQGLHQSQKQLLADLEMLKAGEHLLNNLQAVNRRQATDIANHIHGVELSNVINKHTNNYYNMIDNLVEQVQNDIERVEDKIDTLTKELETLVVNQRYVCSGLICAKKQDNILIMTDSQIKQVKRGPHLGSKKTKVLSCHLDQHGRILKGNKKFVTYENETYIEVDSELISKKCLQNAKNCAKEDFEEPGSQLIDWNYFFQITQNGLNIQCTTAKVLRNQDGTMFSCGINPKRISLPFIEEDSQKVYGLNDILATTYLKNIKEMSWKEYMEGHKEPGIFERKVTGELYRLVSTSFSNLKDTEQLNEHHSTLFLGFVISGFLMGLSMLCRIICKCCNCGLCDWKCWKNKQEDSPDSTTITFMERLTRRWKVLRQSRAESAPSQDSHLPSAPLRASLSDLQRKDIESTIQTLHSLSN